MPANKLPKGAKRKAPTKPAKRSTAPKKAFGRPRTAGKAEGDAAVKAWLSGVKAKHRPIVKELDALIGRTVPDVKRAIKWSMPMYGRSGVGWFASVASFNEYVTLRFFAGTSLKPAPPYGEGKSMRAVNLRSMADFDEARFRSWIKQASETKGWSSV